MSKRTLKTLAATGLATMILSSIAAADARSSRPGRFLSEQEVADAMVGAQILATRGSASEGYIKRALEAMKQGKQFRLLSIEDLPEDGTVVSPSGVGGGTPWPHILDRAKAQGLPSVPNAALSSVRALGRRLNKEFSAVVQNEPAGSTYVAFMIAAELDIPILDGCLSGRARPEIQQQIPFAEGIPGTPAALVSRWGDVIFIESAADDYRLEDLSRALAVASGGGIQMAQNAMSKSEVRRGVIPGVISQSILFGRTVREARLKGTDPVEALCRVAGGFVLFRGAVSKSEHRGEFGFAWGDVEMRGTGPDEGHVYKLFIKNENIMGWRDGKPDAMPPDLICNLDAKTGEALLTWREKGYPLGQEVVLVGIPAPREWRTARGLEIMGPRHFGFDLDYIPLEDLQKARTAAAGSL